MGLFNRTAKDDAAAAAAIAPTANRPAVRAVSPAPVPPPQERLTGVLADLVNGGHLTVERAMEVRTTAETSGYPEHEVVLQREWAPKGEVYAAIERLPSAQRLSVIIQSVRDLPEWSVILNDAGGPLGFTERDPTVLALGVAEDLARAKAAGERQRCFLAATPEAMQSNSYLSLVGRLNKGGYEIRAQLELDSQAIADVAWAVWDQRRGVGAASKRAATVRTLSDTQHLFDRIGQEAYALGASDIHLLAKGGEGSVLFRIDGDVVRQSYDLTADDIEALAGTIYDTLTEKGSTKDGFSKISTQDGSVDRSYDHCRLRFRYSGMPVEPNGYRVAMRVIPIGTHAVPKTLPQLGYARSQCRMLDGAFNRASGLILFSGTTGSGKSFTMSNRSSILVRERPTKVMLTVEDPVEYIIQGAHQTQVRKREGETTQQALHRTLATIMRQDPDILMCGEIRDLATADFALQAVRSGHLMLSTVHAGAAPTCYDRLAGLGVPRLDLSTMDLVSAFAFQALVQTLCPVCRIPASEYKLSKDESIIGLMGRLQWALDKERIPGASQHGDGLDGIYFRNPNPSCSHCRNRGITGRTVCAEVFEPTAEMLPMVAKGDSFGIWEAWRAQINKHDPSDMTGRRAMEHAMWKMAQGDVDPRQVESEFRLLDAPLFKD
ncbi:GspE/PulE family protein [Rhodanobacter sp. 115]|uniref:GspE/PulE family protein n=1 Tax=Rhodanobacter sp. FW021-MT20 TaxID=1162282 RepID=UPI0034E5C420